MNDKDSQVTPYPWYQVGEWSKFEQREEDPPKLEQGDLLPNCPVLIIPNNLTENLLAAEPNSEIDVTPEIQFIDLIIMSQSCDLAQDKIEQVLLCGYLPALDNFRKDDRVSIRKEQRPALHMIEKCEIAGYEFGRQVIDFRTIYTLPKDFILSFAQTLGPRVRLLSPYKEHLSQAFARYFMRVGLPRPLKDE